MLFFSRLRSSLLRGTIWCTCCWASCSGSTRPGGPSTGGWTWCCGTRWPSWPASSTSTSSTPEATAWGSETRRESCTGSHSTCSDIVAPTLRWTHLYLLYFSYFCFNYREVELTNPLEPRVVVEQEYKKTLTGVTKVALCKWRYNNFVYVLKMSLNQWCADMNLFLKCLFVLLTVLLVNGSLYHGSGMQLFYGFGMVGENKFVTIESEEGGGAGGWNQKIHYKCQGGTFKTISKCERSYRYIIYRYIHRRGLFRHANTHLGGWPLQRSDRPFRTLLRILQIFPSQSLRFRQTWLGQIVPAEVRPVSASRRALPILHANLGSHLGKGGGRLWATICTSWVSWEFGGKCRALRYRHLTGWESLVVG